MTAVCLHFMKNVIVKIFGWQKNQLFVYNLHIAGHGLHAKKCLNGYFSLNNECFPHMGCNDLIEDVEVYDDVILTFSSTRFVYFLEKVTAVCLHFMIKQDDQIGPMERKEISQVSLPQQSEHGI